MFGFVWGIIGAALAGSHGLCNRQDYDEDEEENPTTCYYDVNHAEREQLL